MIQVLFCDCLTVCLTVWCDSGAVLSSDRRAASVVPGLHQLGQSAADTAGTHEGEASQRRCRVQLIGKFLGG